MENVILKTQNLTVGYQQSKNIVSICDHINLDIYEGEIICLLGRNGAGKSTLLKTLGNLITPLQGEIFINQKNYRETSSKEFAKNLALVLTDSLPQNSLTVYETIALGRQPYTNWLGNISAKDDVIIQQCLELSDTKELKNKHIHQLSDGQFQRVMIARALAQDSSIILLDEPTSHLDIHHKLNIFKILKKISKETQKTILISTHEINLALKHADRLLLIHNKRLEIGKISEIKTQTTLKEIFNSDEIQFDSESNQFIF